jgi:hypothetical protein
VGLLDLGVGILEKLRVSRLVPRLEIGMEGSARICTDDHVPIHVLGAPDRPGVEPHLDVSLKLWTKGSERVALLDVLEPKAAGQTLHQGSEIGGHGFQELTLEPGATRTGSDFQLSAPEGQMLRAGHGDDVLFRLRLGRNGRRLPVTVSIE